MISAVCCVKAYGDAYHLVEVVQQAEAVAPFIVKNECGSYITVKPGPTFQVCYSCTLLFVVFIKSWMFRYRDSVDNTVEENSNVFFLMH